MNKSRMRMTLKKRKTSSWKNIRLAIALQRLKPKCRSNLITECYDSDYSWQECISWINRVTSYVGKKGDSFDYLCVRYNSVEKAEERYRLKSESVLGENNPAYQHGGKFSALSKNFIHADKTDIEAVKAKIAHSNKHNGNNDTTC